MGEKSNNLSTNTAGRNVTNYVRISYIKKPLYNSADIVANKKFAVYSLLDLTRSS